MIENLTTATPVEIDTELYRLYLAEAAADSAVESAKSTIMSQGGARQNWITRSRWTWSKSFDQALATVTQLAETDATYVGTAAYGMDDWRDAPAIRPAVKDTP